MMQLLIFIISLKKKNKLDINFDALIIVESNYFFCEMIF